MNQEGVVFLDLDETLYPAGNGIWQEISKRINAYLIQTLHLDPDAAVQLRMEYLEQFGTTLAGLSANFQIDPYDYLEFVHDVDVRAHINPDNTLDDMLHHIDLPLYIFTNASRKHALRVLDVLKISNHFLGIIDIVAMNFKNKPEDDAYQTALNLAGAPDPQSCVMVDDRLSNLSPAKALGMTTVWVNPNPTSEIADIQIPVITDLIKALPELSGTNHRGK
jgi:putative hydrolase of the HAD superfamily